MWPDETVRYREYAPSEALRGYVHALFSFSAHCEEQTKRGVLLDVRFTPGERSCAPTFADAHASLVFTFEQCYYPDGHWRRNSVPCRGEVIGPLTAPGPPSVPVRPQSIGAYFRAGAAVPGVPAKELENCAVSLEHFWGAEARDLADELMSLRSEAARLDRLESALIQGTEARSHGRTALDIAGMAAWMDRSAGQLTIGELAAAAGLSRRHLTRLFRERVGVSPKTYCELARFRSALAHVRATENTAWACVAAGCGYADQSHMIAEFRRFAGFTPEALVRGRWFHPFIENPRIRSRLRALR